MDFKYAMIMVTNGLSPQKPAGGPAKLIQEAFVC